MKAHLTRFALTFAAAALLVVVATAPAAADTQTFRSQDTFSVFVPCANGGAGEVVTGILKVHAVLGETVDDNGGFHFHGDVKLQGVGIGSDTGDTYQLHADFPEFIADRVNDSVGDGFNASIDFSVAAIGLGGAPNFHDNLRFQITQNANGVVTMDKQFTSVTCD